MLNYFVAIPIKVRLLFRSSLYGRVQSLVAIPIKVRLL